MAEATVRGGHGAGGCSKADIEAAVALVSRHFALCPNLLQLGNALAFGGLELMAKNCQLTIGTPVSPMLAQVATSIADVRQRFGARPFVCQYKYDGQRAQVHYSSAGVRIFSRTLDDSTGRFPDVVQTIHKVAELAAAASFILDGEIVAVQRRVEGGISRYDIQPFQLLSTRPKTGVDAATVAVDVAFIAFDLLALDGKSLCDDSYGRRLQLLHKQFKPFDGRFDFAQQMVVTAATTHDELETMLEESHSKGQCEGLMVKLLGSDEGDAGDDSESKAESRNSASRSVVAGRYEPGKRSAEWLKLKRDYVKGLADSFDLVPIGAWHGNGRKAGWWSPVLVAAFNPDSGEFESVCRVMSGINDGKYKAMRAKYPAPSPSDEESGHGDGGDAPPTATTSTGDVIALPTGPAGEVCWAGPCPSMYLTEEKPSVWFTPTEVWEVRGAELTISPVHKAGVGEVHPERGLSMRFPRLMKVRSAEDKSVLQATTGEQLARLFRQQQVRFTAPKRGKPK